MHIYIIPLMIDFSIEKNIQWSVKKAVTHRLNSLSHIGFSETTRIQNGLGRGTVIIERIPR